MAINMKSLGLDEEHITAGEFEDATKTVVKTLGSNFNLDVVFAGAKAKTDGQKVFLPSQDHSKKMTLRQYSVAQGYANQETMHNLCTDLPHFNTEMARFKAENKKLAYMCAQALEDVRIETAASVLYPGMPEQITSTADYVTKLFLDEVLPNDEDIVKDFSRIGPVAITWRGRQRLGYDAPYIDEALSKIPVPIMQKIDAWLDALESIPTGVSGLGQLDRNAARQGSRDVVSMAERVAQEIEEFDDEDQQGQGDGEGDGEGDEESGEGNGSGNGDKGGGATRRGASSGTDPVDVDMSQSVSALMNEGDKGNGWRAVSTVCDSLITAKEEGVLKGHNFFGKEGIERYRERLDELGSKVATMRRKLEHALLAKGRAHYQTGHRTGKLDVARRAVDIMRRQENVYRKRIDGQAFDTDVTILVDLSGSMAGHRINMATSVCIALAECLDGCDVGYEVLGYDTGYNQQLCIPDADRILCDAIREIKKNNMVSAFHRSDAVTLYEFKSFDDSLRSARRFIGNMPAVANGGTPEGDGILKALARLIERPAKKKVLFVLTDGEPSYNHIDSKSKIEYTKRAIAYGNKHGVRVIGIGIDTPVKHYPEHVEINDLEDLSKTMIGQVSKILLGEKFVVDNGDYQDMKANA